VSVKNHISMNKVVKYIVSVVIGFLIGCGITVCFVQLNRYNYEESDEEKDYIYLGNENQTIDWKNDAPIYEKGVDPNGVYSRTGGVLPNDSSAVEMAKLILFPIYGKKEIEEEKPYLVRLINNEIWCISGQLKKGYEGGIFKILINKSDGKVLMISHSK